MGRQWPRDEVCDARSQAPRCRCEGSARHAISVDDDRAGAKASPALAEETERDDPGSRDIAPGPGINDEAPVEDDRPFHAVPETSAKRLGRHDRQGRDPASAELPFEDGVASLDGNDRAAERPGGFLRCFFAQPVQHFAYRVARRR